MPPGLLPRPMAPAPSPAPALPLTPARAPASAASATPQGGAGKAAGKGSWGKGKGKDWGKGVSKGKGKGKGSGGKGWTAPLVAAAALSGGAHAASVAPQWSAPPGARLEAAWRGAPLMPAEAAAGGTRTALMVVLQTTPPLVLAAPGGAQLIGAALPPNGTRDSSVGAAQGWLASITRGRLQGTPECFLAGVLRRGDVDEHVVVCPLRAVPAGFPELVVTSPQRLPRAVLRQPMAWASLAALSATPLYDHAALTVARLATFTRPVLKGAGTVTAGAWAVGARPWASVQTPVRVGGPGWGECFADAVERADSADAQLRSALLNVPDDDPYSSYLHGMADSIHPLDPTEVPSAFRDGQLPSYSDPAFAELPYAARCQPPTTAEMAPPVGQPAPAGEVSGRRLDQLITPDGLSRLMEYLGRYHAWLLWLLRTPDQPGPPRPEVLVLGPSYFVEEALGYIWERGSNGSYTPLDLQRPIETHLDLDFLAGYREGYPDQEIFGHLLYGVRLKAPGPHQIMVQPHMVSAVGRFDAIQKELERLQGKGWYEVAAELPFVPFSAIQQGTAERGLEPDRPRRTTNYTAPHREHVDEVGQRVRPVNVAAAQPDPVWAGAGGYSVGLSAPPLPLPFTDSEAPRGVGLHLFSGAAGTSQGLAAEARAQGFGVLEIDLESCPRYDLLDDSTYHSLLATARRGAFRWVVAGIPCETYSVARWRRDADSTARPLRGRSEEDILGLGGLSEAEQADLDRANLLASRACWLCREVQLAGGVYVIENPVDRGEGDFSGPYWPSDHAPLWLMPCVLELQRVTGGEKLSFAQCAFGAATQKYTTLLHSPGLSEHMGWMSGCICTHGRGRKHAEVAVGWDETRQSRSKRAAAYPPSLNATFARDLAAWADQQPELGPSARYAVPESPEAGPAASRGSGKHPPEIKPLVSEAMNDLCPLENASNATGLPVLQGTSDFKDFFNQAQMAQAEKYKCGWLTLAWAGADLDVCDPVLAFVTEHVLGFGCRVASGICQRFADLVMHIFRLTMEDVDDRQLQADPRLATWVEARTRLSQETGRDESRLWTCHCYTDDPWFACLGVGLMVTMLRVWHWVTASARLLMAIPAKQQLGTCVKWLGVRLAAGLGIAYVPPDKQARALHGIREVREGRSTVEQYRSLVGLLVHLLFLAGMARGALYGLFTPFQAGGLAEGGPTTYLRGEALTPVMLSQLAGWERRLEGCAGAPFHAAAPGWRAPVHARAAGMTHFLRSDAAKEGAAVPGICGHWYGRYWIHELTPEELELPIGVLELIGGCGNLALYGPELGGAHEVMLELDALASPQVLASSRAKSALMQHVHLAITAEPGYLAVEDRLSVAHLFGPANAPSDAGSRGRERLMRELLVVLGCAPRRERVPPFVTRMLRELVVLNRRLTAEEQFRGPTRRNEYTSDGPSGVGMRGHPYRPPAVGGRLPGSLPASWRPPPGWAPPVAARLHEAPSAPSVGGRLDGGRARGAPPAFGLARPSRQPSSRPDTAGVGARLLLLSAVEVSSFGGGSGPAASPLFGGWAATPRAGMRWASLPFTGVRLPAPNRSVAAPPHVQVFATAQLREEADSLTGLLRGDDSPWAIPTHKLGLVDEISLDVYGLAADGRPVGTRKQQRSDWKHWTAWCSHLGVSPWRLDARANAGLDPVGARREAFILAGGLRFIYNRMQPKRRADPVPQPQSALNVILGVRRMHRDKGHPMVAMPMVGAVVKGLMRRIQEEYGESHPDLLLPKRKEPFTIEILDRLSSIPSGTVRVAGRQTLVWESEPGRALWALLCTLCSTGLRKSEVCRTSSDEKRPIAMRSSVRYRIGGVVLSAPTADQLRSMGRKDCVIFTPPPSKADQFGTVWGASPIYLSWGSERRNACRALVAMELGAMVSAGARSSTPLFSPREGRPYTGSALDSTLRAMLLTFLPPAQAALYSWHSARIYLACALKAAGASPGQIQALCRWVSEQSLHIYARLNETTYSYWLNRAMVAPVNSTRTTSLAAGLPPLDDDDVVRGLLTLNLVEREGD